MLSGFKTRKPWAAAVIGLIPLIPLPFMGLPFMGMLYLNRGWLAMGYFFAELALTAACFAAAHYQLAVFNPRVAAGIGSIILQVIVAGHCYAIAKRWKTQKPKWYARWYNVIMLSIVMPALIIFLFKLNYYEQFKTSNQSMEPALMPEDYFLVDKQAYRNHPPGRGDVVLFKVRLDTGVVEYVKRIVGLPGDKIQVLDGTLYINDKPLPRRDLPDSGDDKKRFVETLPEGKDITLQEDKATVPGANPNNYSMRDEEKLIYTVPDKQYFVIGDYIGRSSDSRNGLGFVDRHFIVGKATAVIWNDKTYRLSWREVE